MIWKKKPITPIDMKKDYGYTDELIDALIRCDLPTDRPVSIQALVLALEKRVTNLE